jgi:DNA segregation ATPase FtsK/SpoIIIE-like protein
MNFIRRRIHEIMGLSLIGLALFIALSLLDYYPSDPSLTVASNAEVKNIMGSVGAYIANPILQFLGLAGGALPFIIFITWGWKLLYKRPTTIWWMRLSLLIFALVPAAALLNLISSTESYRFPQGLGGYIGIFITQKTISSLGTATFVAGAFFVLCGALYVAFGLTWAEWQFIGYHLREWYYAVMDRKKDWLRKMPERRAPKLAANMEVEENNIAVDPVKRAPRAAKPKQEKFDLRRADETHRHFLPKALRHAAACLRGH